MTVPSPSNPVDLAIIGGGPTGLFAAFYAGLRRMSVEIIDSLDALGGQLTALYPEKYIYDVAGFPKILAKDLAANLIRQAMQYSPAVCLGQHVLSLDYDSARREFNIVTLDRQHPARAILIAAGVGAFRPKKLPLANAHQYEGHGLSYFVHRIEDFRARRVLIVGGGDSAVDWANTLAPVTAEQTLIHRRDTFRAHEQSVTQLKHTPTRILLFHELKAIGGNGRLEWATIYDNRTNNEQTLSVDAILVNVGFQNSLGPITEWGLELEGGSIKVDSMMRTNRPDIFAAGDIATYPGKLKLIATGFADACIAVNYAKTYLDPAARAFPGHSSEMKR
ncbi:MAG: NAD(P)/FAD-dependent oxidoreductase [Bacillota bacterium]